MLVTTGRKEKLTISKGSEIEVSSHESSTTGNVRYHAILDENLPKSKRKKLAVRHLKPLVNENHTPPLLTSTLHRLIRPLPPQDPFPELDFEEGDRVEAAVRGGWWSGTVVKVLPNRNFSVYLGFEPDVVQVDRKELRPHLVWKNDEWFRYEKKELVDESEFSAGKNVEVRTEVEQFGDVWVPAIAIKEKYDDDDDDDDDKEKSLLVKYKSLNGEGSKICVPYSRIRPSPSPVGLRAYELMKRVEARNEFGWCCGIVSRVLFGNRYSVLLGKDKKSYDFNYTEIRPVVEWENGAWQTEETVLDTEEPALRDVHATGAGQNLRATRSTSVAMHNPSPLVKESVAESETPLAETAALSKDVVMTENTPVISQPEITATSATKPTGKTQGKTSPRMKLQAMKNQKGSAKDSVAEKAPEETRNRESVNKRKRGQPRKFVSIEPKQKTGLAGNGSNAATAELADDDTPLASWIHGGNPSSGQQSGSLTPDPMLNAVVEKHIVETPPVNDSTMVLPFVKKSPLWKVIESMEQFKSVPQHPHFSPLVEIGEESREGDAIGAMVKFTGLIDKVKQIQVDDPVSVIKRIDDCFLQLEKHGFNVTVPRARICKLLAMKESQTWALEELKVAERELSENDNKRRKCEEEIAELQERLVLLKEEKVTMDMEIARTQSHAAVLDQKVQNAEQKFQAIVTAPWN